MAQDYRIFVGAFPTGQLAEQIQAVRLRYDHKTALITAPHVTLAGTYWRSGPSTAANEAATIEKLQALAGKLPAFDLNLGGIHHFDGRVVYLGVETTAVLLQVRQTLLNLLGQDKHRQFAPHLTLAMRLNERDTQAMIHTLQQSEWQTGRFAAPIHQLCLMQRGPQDPSWRTIFRINLI